MKDNFGITVLALLLLATISDIIIQYSIYHSMLSEEEFLEFIDEEDSSIVTTPKQGTQEACKDAEEAVNR